MRMFSKLRNKWTVSIISVAAVVLLVCSFLFCYLVAAIGNSLREKNTDMVRFLQTNADERFLEIQRFVAALDTVSADLSEKIATHNDDQTKTRAYRLSAYMKSYKTVNPLINQIFIYYKDADTVVGYSGCFEKTQYYALMNGLNHTGSGKFFAQIETIRAGFALLPPLDNTTVLSFIKPINLRRETIGYIVVQFDSEKLLNPLQSGIRYSINLDGKPVSFYGQPAGTEADVSGSIEIPSFFRNLSYSGYYTDRMIVRQLQKAIVVTLAGILAALILAVSASFVIGRYSTRPLDRIMIRLGAEKEKKSEFSILSDRIDSLLELDRKLLEKYYMISSVFLESMIEKKVQNAADIVKYAAKYGVDLDFPCYALGAVELQSGIGETAQIVTRFVSGFINAMVTVFGSYAVILLPLEESDDIRSAENQLETIIAAVLPEFKRAGIGNIYDSFDGFLYSYDQAISALSKTPAGKILSYEVMLYGDGDQTFSVEKFRRLTETGRFDEAAAQLPVLFDRIFDHTESPEVRKIKFRCVEKNIAAALSRAGACSVFSFETETLLFEQTRNALLFLSDGIGGAVPEGFTEKAHTLILERYRDPRFGLYQLSQEIGISNSYLSTKFKATYGVGVAQYINRLRIEAAKALLLSSDLCVKEIAREVGFSSDIVFVRAFKKTEKITPGAYGRK